MRKNNVVICDLGFGDNAKGKTADWYLSNRKMNTAVRFSGGPNGGHQIVYNDKKYVLHVLPSGVFHKNVVSVVATGTCVDPIKLKIEIDNLASNDIQISPYNLRVSTLCPVITRIHIAKDMYDEEKLGENKIGSTLCGISPVSTDKMARRGLVFIDLIDKVKIKKKITQEYYIDSLLKYNLRQSYDQFIDELYEHGKYFEPYFTDTSLFLDQRCMDGGVLFEGSQSALLDINSPYYPYVSTTSTLAGAAAASSAISPKYLDEIVGVSKCYLTRSGKGGVFPTEYDEEMSTKMASRGHEVGLTSGRRRRTGALDLVLLKHSIRVNGCDSLVISKFDVLSGMPNIKLNTHYTIDGVKFEHLPTNYDDIIKAVPNYITLKAWNGDLTNMRSAKELPTELFEFIEVVEDFLGLPIKLIGVGPNREQTIELK